MISSDISHPGDAASIATTCRRLRHVCKRAPFRLHLGKLYAPELASSTEAQARLHSWLTSLSQSFPGTIELNLANLPLGNDGVALIEQHLPNLASLKLAGCKKLTLSGIKSAAAVSALQCIDAQRCFQLSGEALTEFLAASARPYSKLSCLALSHLDLSSWKAPFQGPGSVLRLLALHNGVKLTTSGLRGIAISCQHLEVLCLGGSNLAFLPTVATVEEEQPSNRNITPPHEEEAGVSHPSFTLPNLLDPSSTIQYNCGVIKDDDPLVSHLEHAAGKCSIHSAFLESSHGTWLRSTAAELIAAACKLPRLYILELTFCGLGLTSLLPRMLEAASLSSSGGQTNIDKLSELISQTRERLQIWDMCSPSSVIEALQWRSRCHATSSMLPCTPRKYIDQALSVLTISSSSSSPMRTTTAPLPISEVDTILAAMARCSSPGRVTALHSAAEEGNVSHLSGLLSLGAEVDARDRGGASALFCACEAGHTGAVARLLAAGASATLRNAAGEAPLYIAALRGHDRVVEVLLKHCRTTGIRWQDPRLYGDGWTPLHAAAVSGRAAIAAQLLSAAGLGASSLVSVSNRYGQTSVHVAARKGSLALVQMLVEAGGSESLAVEDSDGRTPADVARRNGNSGAWRYLSTGGLSARNRQHMQRATTPSFEKPRHAPLAQQVGARWVGRRLQQRKSGQQQPQPQTTSVQ